MKLKKCLSFINTKTNGKMTVLRALLVLIVMLLTSATAWADITTGTFADLAQEINIALSTGNYVQLTKDVYTYAGSGSVIDISKSCTIDGNSATIDMTGSDISVFKISAGITIKNLTIKNASNTAIVVDGNNCTVENCTFIDNNATNSSVIYVNGTDCTIKNCAFINNGETTIFFSSSEHTPIVEDNRWGSDNHTVDILNGVSTGGEKYITYCSDEGNWKVSNASVLVYVVTGYNLATGEVSVNPIDGNEIPNGVPVIIGNKTDGNALPANLILQKLSDGAASSISGRLANFFVCDGTKDVGALLTAALGSTADLSDYVLFMLSGGSFKPVSATAESKPAKGTCVLAVSKVDILTKGSLSVGGTSNARTLTIDLGGDTTGIVNQRSTAEGEGNSENGIVNSEQDAWHSLDGRKLSGWPTRKGIYLRNGQAVVIK